MTIENLMSTLGVVVPLASVLASALNQYVRDAQAKGEVVPAWLLHVAGLLNVTALNGDKAMQMIKLAQSLKNGLKGKAQK